MAENQTLCQKLSQKHSLDMGAALLSAMPAVMVPLTAALEKGDYTIWFEIIGGFVSGCAALVVAPRMYTVYEHCCGSSDEGDSEASLIGNSDDYVVYDSFDSV